MSDLSDPMDCSLQAPPSMGFSRQEYWSGLPLPSPRIFLEHDINIFVFVVVYYIIIIFLGLSFQNGIAGKRHCYC